MSVQLEVLPQNYEGFLAQYYPASPEYVVDGEEFNSGVFSGTPSFYAVTVTSSLAGGALQTIQDAMVALNIVNIGYSILQGSWMVFRNPALSGTTPDYPVKSGSQVFLKGSGAGDNKPTVSGIAQRLSNLTVGTEYTITVTIGTVVATGAVPSNNKLYFGCTFGNNTPVNSVTAMTGTPLTSTPFAAGAYSPISPINSSTAGQVYTRQFVAESTTDVLVIAAELDNSIVVGIEDVSVIYSHGGQLSGILGDGSVICDLYEDEDIPLSLSVDDFKNVAEKVQSYSKAFSLPATKRNSRIFDHVFEITRSAQGNNSFNPYIKTQCRLKEDGIVLFEGYLRLIDIQDKEGEVSFSVNLYSEAVALADILKDRKFSDLDLSELDHPYTRNSIVETFTGALTYTNAGTSGFRTSETVRYPFCDWEHQYLVQSNGNPELVNLEGSFRPFINVKYLIDRIFNQTAFPFSYTSAFFNTADFERLYMDFNWGDATTPTVFTNSGGLGLIGQAYNPPLSTINVSYFPLTTSYQTVDFDELADYFNGPQTTLHSNFGYSGGTFTAVTDNQLYDVNYFMNFFVIVNTSSATFTATFVHTTAGGIVTNYESGTFSTSGGIVTSNNYVYSGSFTVVMNTGDTLHFKAKKISGGDMGIQGANVITGTGTALYNNNLLTITTIANNTVSATLLQTLRGELGQWEFLKGIFTMFNLITIPDKSDPSNILIEPYKDVFIQNTSGTSLASRGIARDWTDKISVEEMKLTPLTDLNKTTMFKFVEDDDDYAFNVYKRSNGGALFGSKVYDASGFTILEGEEEIVAEPFAATFCKPLMSQFPDFIVPTIYSYDSTSGESSSFDNSPRILYLNGQKSLPFSYRVPAQNGVSAADLTQFLQFSHLSSIPTVVNNPPLSGDTRDFNFGEHNLVSGMGLSPVLNLFNTYWLPYLGELYNPDTRTMSIKVDLSAADISTFDMYDTVFIKNREFRVNKIDYKPHDLSTVEFILIP